VSFRILHVLDHSVPLHSGYAFRTLAILREQRALGWTPVPLTGVKQGGSDELLHAVDGFQFHRTPPSRGPLSRVPVAAELDGISRLAGRIQRVATEHRFDLIHAHSPVLDVMAALRAARVLRLPVVYEVRALWEDARGSPLSRHTRAGGARGPAGRGRHGHLRGASA
jgi:glycogen(starch) synthase